jgi:archaellum component FlaC
MSLLDAFKKKEASDLPDISDMVQSGMSEQDIIDNLRQKGYDSTAIKDALINSNLSARGAEPGQAARMDIGSVSTQLTPEPNAPPRTAQEALEPQSVMQPTTSVIQQFRQPASQASEQQAGISDKAMDTIQGILEQIIEEKWQAASSDIDTFKNALNTNKDNVNALDEKIENLSRRIDSIQNTILGKTEEYNKTLSDVNVELQAFEKVIDRLVPAISDSIKELRDLVEGLKKGNPPQ